MMEGLQSYQCCNPAAQKEPLLVFHRDSCYKDRQDELRLFRSPSKMHGLKNIGDIGDLVMDSMLVSVVKSSDAPVAQLDRASDFESAGRPFESGRVRHNLLILLRLSASANL